MPCTPPHRLLWLLLFYIHNLSGHHIRAPRSSVDRGKNSCFDGKNTVFALRQLNMCFILRCAWLPQGIGTTCSWARQQQAGGALTPFKPEFSRHGRHLFVCGGYQSACVCLGTREKNGASRLTTGLPPAHPSTVFWGPRSLTDPWRVCGGRSASCPRSTRLIGLSALCGHDH